MKYFGQRRIAIATAIVACTLLPSAGCQEDEFVLPVNIENLPERRIATLYQIQLSDSDHKAPCYRLLDDRSLVSTRLDQDDFVDLVDVAEGMYRYKEEFWLHVHPRLTHRPSCYINVRYLIPYA